MKPRLSLGGIVWVLIPWEPGTASLGVDAVRGFEGAKLGDLWFLKVWSSTSFSTPPALVQAIPF